MNTAIPLAVVDRYTDPSSDTAARITIPATNPTPGDTARSGHQPPTAPVITTDAAYSSATYSAHTAAAPRKRPSSSCARPSGRTTSGCSSPRSASPRTAPRVRNTASTVPRKSVANIARPSSVAPVSACGSRSPTEPIWSVSWNAALAPSPYSARKPAVSTSTTANTRRRRLSRSAYPAIATTALISTRLPAHGLEVDLLERRGEDAHTVDRVPGASQRGHDPGRILPPGLRIELHALVGLDLDTPRARELRRSPGGNEGAL